MEPGPCTHSKTKVPHHNEKWRCKLPFSTLTAKRVVCGERAVPQQTAKPLLVMA